MINKLRETNHSYYCSDSNYYVNAYNNFGLCEYSTWEDFKENFIGHNLEIDHDYNHCFRFDIKPKDDDWGNPIQGKYSLNLYFVLQRKGIFRPVIINEVHENDLSELNKYLSDCWDYLKRQWVEFSELMKGE